MATTQKLVTKKFNVENAKQFVKSVINNDSAYHMFTGRHIPYIPDDSIIAVPNDSVQSSTIDMYNNMIFGKRIMAADVNHMIPRYDWTSGTVYSMYDHEDGNLFNEQFYTVVTNGTNYDVYKCIDNNFGAKSTVQPSGYDINPIYSPVDGYAWKYMYTATGAVFDKFKTNNYIPVVANNTVIANAKAGTIEHISVSDGGLGYNNYFISQFRVTDIRIGGSEVTYAINESASSLNSFYQGCVIKMTSGAAANEYREIVNYAIVNSQKVITLKTAFTNKPQATDSYEIYPLVYVYGDGNETSQCSARAIVNPAAGNTISKIEILNPGLNYRAAVSALNVMQIVNVTRAAVLRSIISPTGGHGSDPLHELGANRVGVSVLFSNTENGFIPVMNDYRTVGIIKDVEFDNVTIQLDLTNTHGGFFLGETVHQYRDIRLAGTIATSTNIATVTGTGTYFDTSLVAGDYVYLTDGTNRFFTQVSTVTNSTSFNCSTNVPWSGSGCSISIIKESFYGVVTATSTGTITISKVETKNITSDIKLFGDSSYAISQINTSAPMPKSINGVIVNGTFDTFVELGKFVGTVTSANTAYILDEVVRQDSTVSYTQPTARFHSYVSNNSTSAIYVSNINNIFNTNVNIINSSNTVVFSLSNKYLGDLVKDTGKILYIENIDPITRQYNKAETVKVILEF